MLAHAFLRLGNTFLFLNKEMGQDQMKIRFYNQPKKILNTQGESYINILQVLVSMNFCDVPCLWGIN
jgi:hypothetical protein